MKKLSIIFILLFVFSVFSCKETQWKPGTPIKKEEIKIGVVHITDPFSENAGYSFAHQRGIEEMKKALFLDEGQFFYKTHLDDSEPLAVENGIRQLIANEVNLIIATSWGYMDVCEKLSQEFPNVIFAHATGYKYNDSNFTNYFGKVYEARYLSGIIAGTKTTTNKIGYVAAWGKENSEVTGGINAFALGVQSVNPNAEIYVKVTHSWFDPMGEANAARVLIAAGCDIIAQHCDTAYPQIEAQRAGVFGIGYNTDMRSDAPQAVLTSVIWNWGVYYTQLVQSIINGTFNTTPWYGALEDGIVDLAHLGSNASWSTEFIRLLMDERRRIETGDLKIFDKVIITNDGRSLDLETQPLSEDEIRNSIDWYYRNVIEL